MNEPTEPVAETLSDGSLAFLNRPGEPAHPLAIGGMEIKCELGRGGMAVVYRARDPHLGRDVALKVSTDSHATTRARFLRELRVAGMLQHSNIVPAFSADSTATPPYLVMQLIDGVSLRDRLRKGSPLDLHEAVDVVKDVCAALTCAHAQGVIHRDVTPGNILLGKDRVYLADFGIASIADSDDDLTQGDMPRTPRYCSPEHEKAPKAVERRSDLYSLGVVAYEMVVGELPPPARVPGDAFLQRARCTFPRAGSAQRKLEASLFQFFVKALATAPDDRFSTAGEFADQFAAAVTGVGRDPCTPRKRLAQPIVLAATASTVLVAVLFALLSVHHLPDSLRASAKPPGQKYPASSGEPPEPIALATRLVAEHGRQDPPPVAVGVQLGIEDRFQRTGVLDAAREETPTLLSQLAARVPDIAVPTAIASGDLEPFDLVVRIGYEPTDAVVESEGLGGARRFRARATLKLEVMRTDTGASRQTSVTETASRATEDPAEGLPDAVRAAFRSAIEPLSDHVLALKNEIAAGGRVLRFGVLRGELSSELFSWLPRFLSRLEIELGGDGRSLQALRSGMAETSTAGKPFIDLRLPKSQAKVDLPVGFHGEYRIWQMQVSRRGNLDPVLRSAIRAFYDRVRGDAPPVHLHAVEAEGLTLYVVGEQGGEVTSTHPEGNPAPGERHSWAELVAEYDESIFLLVALWPPDELPPEIVPRVPADFVVSGGIGTGWCLDSNGLLATNAHVAEMFRNRRGVAIQNKTGKKFAVRDFTLHEEYDPERRPALNPDVALIRIDGRGETFKPIPLASPTDLAVGDALMTLGFPGELWFEYADRSLPWVNAAGELDPVYLFRVSLDAPAPGVLCTFRESFVSGFRDRDGAAGTNPEASCFVQCSWTGSGGTSGSPMIDRQGKVAVIHNSANKEVGSHICYGNRVDILADFWRRVGW
ncbi:MAG: protein kinase [Planctomycetota bacterium]